MAASPMFLLAAATLLLLVFLLHAPSTLQVTAAAAADVSADEAKCRLSFNGLENATLVVYRTVAWRCPANCTRLLGQAALQPPHDLPPPNASSSASVLGSFPYHGASSICLSAVHCGLISDASGGSVWVHPFLRQDWSQSSTSTIFPYNSSSGSLSNGVSSVTVPADWYSVPSSSSERSFAVHGRGEFVVQKRDAPFPPRAGHLHVVVDSETAGTIHLILGGYNGSHYLNDVWVASQGQADDRRPLVDVEWERLPDAPFSPRADMGYIGEGDWLRRFSFHLFGGQTGDMCGLRELGVCSDEIWTLRLNRTSGVSVWSWNGDQPVARLPSHPRCGASVTPLGGWTGLLHREYGLSVFGGQLSYNDSSCQAPIVMVNTSWASKNLTGWWRVADLPWTPRRSMVIDDAFRAAAFYYNIIVAFAPGFVGGYRLLGHQYDAALGRSVLTGVEVFSDIWRCYGNARNSTAGCEWADSAVEAAPMASVPLPVVTSGVSWLCCGTGLVTTNIPALRFGGFTSAKAVTDWRNTPAVLDDDEAVDQSQIAVNLTTIRRWNEPLAQLSDRLTLQGLISQRRGLPLSYALDMAEINDPAGSYTLGTTWVQAHTPVAVRSVLMPMGMSTAHEQPLAMPLTPADSGLYVWQAAAAFNSSRGQFNFAPRRLQHAVAQWGRSRLAGYNSSGLFGQTTISGGRSGSAFYSDWITMQEIRCIPPDDPTFAQALGPLRLLLNASSVDNPDWGSYSQLSRVTVACQPGFHLEPPEEMSRTQAELYCMPDGMWVDMSLQTVRRCVRDRLNCSFPLVDVGGFQCEEPVPELLSIALTYRWSGTHGDGLTLWDVPLVQVSAASGVLETQLSIRGRWFRYPIHVTIGGYECDLPVLVDSDNGTVCHNLSHEGSVCDLYYSTVLVGMPQVYGTRLPVLVYSSQSPGPALSATGRLAIVSTTPPIILSLDAADCSAGSGTLRLAGCPNSRPFRLSVCAAFESTDELSISVSLAERELSCSRFEVADDLLRFNVSCASCHVPAVLGSDLRLRLQQVDTHLESREAATLSFSDCPAGTMINAPAVLAGFSSPLCIDCPPGSSTATASAQSACQLCRPGYFANVSRQPDCHPCPRGTFSAQYNSTSCSLCPLNSYQNFTAETRCDVCDLNHYIAYESQQSAQAGLARCLPCPAGAQCSPAGNITAQAGSFLFVDQPSGSVSYSQCLPSVCLDGGSPQCPQSGSPPLIIARSQLPVRNCCSQGRYPAYDPSSPQLAATDGNNVLCATCLSGHSLVNGRCIPCSETNTGALSAVVLLALLLVYLVHRLPHDWSGSASLAVASYFLQQSTLFLSSESMPQVVSLLSVNLLGDNSLHGGDDSGLNLYSGACVVPLSDAGRIVMALLSPLIAFAALAGIAAAHLTVRAALIRRTWSSLSRGRLAARLYRRFLVPSTVKRQEPDATSHLLHKPLLEEAEGGSQSASSLLSADNDSLSSIWLSYQRTAVRLTQLSYTNVAFVTLSFFWLQSVGPYGYRLVIYPSIDPSSAEYRMLLPVIATLVALFVCGLPSLVLLFLWRQHRAGEISALEAASKQRVSSGDLTPTQSLTLQLCAMVRLECWWFPSLMVLWRLLLIVVLVERTAACWVWLTLLNYCLLAIHLQLQPYERKRDNALQSLTLLSLSLQTSLLAAWPPPTMSAALLSALLALLVIPTLCLIADALYRRGGVCGRCLSRSGVSDAATEDDETL